MTKRNWGISLVSFSILLVLLFFIPGYHTMYWAHPVIFISFTVIGVISALYGSYLFRINIRQGSESKELLYKLLVLFGGLVFALGFCAGFFAISFTFFIGLGTGDWGNTFSGFSDYAGDWHMHILLAQISLFGLAVVCSLLGQFFIGIGHHKR